LLIVADNPGQLGQLQLKLQWTFQATQSCENFVIVQGQLFG